MHEAAFVKPIFVSLSPPSIGLSKQLKDGCARERIYFPLMMPQIYINVVVG